MAENSINASDFGTSTKRRLPICFCLDTSGSMMGNPIKQLNQGLSNFIASIKANDDTRSATDIAIITFGSLSRSLCRSVRSETKDFPRSMHLRP